MLNLYERTIFALLCSKKKESTSEHWYWHHYQRINISKERTNKEEGYTYSPVTQCRCREKRDEKKDRKKKKTLTTML
jgi:hypothetical protein